MAKKDETGKSINEADRKADDIKNGRHFLQNPLKWASDKLGTDEAERRAQRVERATPVEKAEASEGAAGGKSSGSKQSAPKAVERDPMVAEAQFYMRALGYDKDKADGKANVGGIDGVNGKNTKAVLKELGIEKLDAEGLAKLKAAVEADPNAIEAAKNMQGNIAGPLKDKVDGWKKGLSPAAETPPPAAEEPPILSAEEEQGLPPAGTETAPAPGTPEFIGPSVPPTAPAPGTTEFIGPPVAPTAPPPGTPEFIGPPAAATQTDNFASSVPSKLSMTYMPVDSNPTKIDLIKGGDIDFMGSLRNAFNPDGLNQTQAATTAPNPAAPAAGPTTVDPEKPAPAIPAGASAP